MEYCSEFCVFLTADHAECKCPEEAIPISSDLPIDVNFWIEFSFELFPDGLGEVVYFFLDDDCIGECPDWIFDGF